MSKKELFNKLFSFVMARLVVKKHFVCLCYYCSHSHFPSLSHTFSLFHSHVHTFVHAQIHSFLILYFSVFLFLMQAKKHIPLWLVLNSASASQVKIQSETNTLPPWCICFQEWRPRIGAVNVWQRYIQAGWPWTGKWHVVSSWLRDIDSI